MEILFSMERSHPTHWSLFSTGFPLLLLVLFFASSSSAVVTTKTDELRRRETTLINLHDLSLEENTDLDLTVDAASAAEQVWDRIGQSTKQRLQTIFEKTKTAECRAKIGEHMGHYINAFGLEEPLPFYDIQLENSCPEPVYADWDSLPEGVNWGHIQNREYKPENGTYIDDPKNLNFLYAILTHNNAPETIRLIEALYEDGHVFVIHVDGKESSDATYDALVNYSGSNSHVHVLPSDYRCGIQWGGFEMVNATLQILKYVFALTDDFEHEPLDFHKVVHLASTSYPIQSNTAIRNKIAEYPLDANMMHIIMKPSEPSPHGWFYFVECDDRLHRVGALRPLNEKEGGIYLYTSSQWFVISREFAYYLGHAEPGSFVHKYLDYIQHVVVADETFFGTVLRSTHFCTKHHNWHFLHLEFDRWESDLGEKDRDERKCMMKRKDHCGRSPTTMTMDYLDVMELTGDLFARKFDEQTDAQVKDVIDERRHQQELELTGKVEPEERFNTDFEGHGVLILAKETAKTDKPLCMGIGDKGNNVKLIPCFFDEIVPALADGWETGAVIEEEILMHNKWTLGPCSRDGKLQRLYETAEMAMTPGKYSPSGPKCMLKQGEGVRTGRCLDADAGKSKPGGGPMKVHPCVNSWNQYFSFGNGTLAPVSAIHATVPKHLIRGLKLKDYTQEEHMCVGVYGRGDADEDWSGEKVEEEYVEETSELTDEQQEQQEDGSNSEQTDEDEFEGEYPLSIWEGLELVTTKCSNRKAVIEWLFVPYIVEDDDDSNSTENSTTADMAPSADEHVEAHEDL